MHVQSGSLAISTQHSDTDVNSVQHTCSNQLTNLKGIRFIVIILEPTVSIETGLGTV